MNSAVRCPLLQGALGKCRGDPATYYDFVTESGHLAQNVPL